MRLKKRPLTSKRKPRQRLEDGLQRAVVDLLGIYERQGKLRYFAVPNGGKRSKIEAAIMKGLGTRAGVPDLVILLSSGMAIFWELKAEGNGPSPAQHDWLNWLGCNHFLAATIYNVDQANKFLKMYLQDKAA